MREARRRARLAEKPIAQRELRRELGRQDLERDGRSSLRRARDTRRPCRRGRARARSRSVRRVGAGGRSGRSSPREYTAARLACRHRGVTTEANASSACRRRRSCCRNAARGESPGRAPRRSRRARASRLRRRASRRRRTPSSPSFGAMSVGAVQRESARGAAVDQPLAEHLEPRANRADADLVDHLHPGARDVGVDRPAACRCRSGSLSATSRAA